MKMPPGGGSVRAEQLATLDRISHETFTSTEIGRLLDELAPFEEAQPYDSDEASLIRVTRRDWEKARRVPAELRAEMSRAGLAGVARRGRRPGRPPTTRSSGRTCEKNLELRRRYIDCFDGYDEPYDVLLDDFERGMTTAEVRAVFDRLKEEQIPLVAGASRNGDRPARDRSFPLEQQQRFELEGARALRLRPRLMAARPDRAPVRQLDRDRRHPADDPLPRDEPRRPVRLDARVRARAVRARRRPRPRADAARPRDVARHARVAEPPVGEPRRPQQPVLELLLPACCRSTSRRRSAEVELDDWFASVNWVAALASSASRPTRRRTTCTSSCGSSSSRSSSAARSSSTSCPRCGTTGCSEYLGVEPPDDRLGVLQDMHWAAGHIGYFPTYALGNVISAQIWERVLEELPDVYDQFERGRVRAAPRVADARTSTGTAASSRPRRRWSGSLAVGLDAEPYLRYLSGKLASLPR